MPQTSPAKAFHSFNRHSESVQAFRRLDAARAELKQYLPEDFDPDKELEGALSDRYESSEKQKSIAKFHLQCGLMGGIMETKGRTVENGQPRIHRKNSCAPGARYSGYFFMYSIKSATITLTNISIIESISKSDIVYSPSFQENPVDRAVSFLLED